PPVALHSTDAREAGAIGGWPATRGAPAPYLSRRHVRLFSLGPRGGDQGGRPERGARLVVEHAERRARVVILEDLLRPVAALRHRLRAPLRHAHAMTVAASGDVRRGTVHG